MMYELFKVILLISHGTTNRNTKTEQKGKCVMDFISKNKATCTTFTDFILCNGLDYVFYVLEAT